MKVAKLKASWHYLLQSCVKIVENLRWSRLANQLGPIKPLSKYFNAFSKQMFSFSKILYFLRNAKPMISFSKTLSSLG